MANKKANVLSAVISVTGEIAPGLTKAIQGVTSELSSLDKASLAVSAAVTATAATVAKFCVNAVGNAADLEKQMSNVATLLDGNTAQVAERVGELSDEVLKVSNSTGVVTSDLTDGLYQVISAFGDSADSIAIMETAAKAAKAGNASTTDSINLLSAVTKAYGNTSAEANEKVADLAFQTVKLGQTSFTELASSMQQVTGYSNTLGVSQEELFGVFATATGVTGETSAVATQLKAVYSNLLKPTTAMTEVMEALGFASSETMIDQLGLQGTLEALSGAVNGDTSALASMFSSTEALNLVLGLTGDLSETLAEKTEAMFAAVEAGAAQTAFEAQTDNLQDTIAAIKNIGTNFMTEVGMELLPVVKELAQNVLPTVAEWIPAIADGIGVIIANADKLIPILSGVIAGFTAFKVIKTVTTLMTSLKAITAGVSTVQGVLNAVVAANPFVIAAAAIAALIAAGVALYQNWDTIKEKLIPLKESIASLWQSIKDGAAGVAESVLTPFRLLAKGVNSIIDNINAISVTVPDWIPKIGGKKFGFNIPNIPAFAEGGFTNGISIAGEAGTEAVISFNSAYRDENIGYWRTAGRMLGAIDDDTSESEIFSTYNATDTTYDLSGLIFAPTIQVNGSADTEEIIQKLKDIEPEFIDFILKALKQREGNVYA